MASTKPDPRSSEPVLQETESFEATARRMLESALALYAAERPLVTREIGDAVKRLVAHARARGLQAERMIIELKHACYSAESAAHQKSEVVSRLVTMCIREFYGAESEPLDG